MSAPASQPQSLPGGPCPDWCTLEPGHAYTYEPVEPLPWHRCHLATMGDLSRWGMALELTMLEQTWDPAAPTDPDAFPALMLRSCGSPDHFMLHPTELESFTAAMAHALQQAAQGWQQACAENGERA